MVLRQGKHGQFYGCSRYPDCKETHGCHPDGTPLGKPVIKKVRELRTLAHKKLSKIWDYKDSNQRNKMYGWLKLNTKKGHIGKMGEKDIKKLLVKIRKYIKKTKEERK